MILSGLLFVCSIPIIALSHGYESLVLGRLLQGISAGLIGVVVPLYLAECLAASNRGKGTGIFQWLLTLGIVTAAVVGMYFSFRVEEVAQAGRSRATLRLQRHGVAQHFLGVAAARHLVRDRQPHGVGVSALAVSPRKKGCSLRRASPLAHRRAGRSRTGGNGTRRPPPRKRKPQPESASRGAKVKESLLRRKYVIPFVLACVILACNQATGVNSIIGYNTNILLQAGLSDVQAHWGYVLFTIVNFLMTIGGVMLVDRKGRKFLLSVGSAGIIVSLLCTGRFSAGRKSCASMRGTRFSPWLMSTPIQKVTLRLRREGCGRAARGERQPLARAIGNRPTSLVVIYSYGDFRAATKVARSDDKAAKPIEITRESCVPANKVVAFFSNPFSRSRGRAPGSAKN